MSALRQAGHGPHRAPRSPRVRPRHRRPRGVPGPPRATGTLPSERVGRTARQDRRRHRGGGGARSSARCSPSRPPPATPTSPPDPGGSTTTVAPTTTASPSTTARPEAPTSAPVTAEAPAPTTTATTTTPTTAAPAASEDAPFRAPFLLNAETTGCTTEGGVDVHEFRFEFSGALNIAFDGVFYPDDSGDGVRTSTHEIPAGSSTYLDEVVVLDPAGNEHPVKISPPLYLGSC